MGRAALALAVIVLIVAAALVVAPGREAGERACAAVEAGAEHHTPAHTGGPLGGLFSGPRANDACQRRGGPESFADLAAANSAQVSRDVAPGTQVKAGAARAALAHASALPTTGGQWQPYGNSPLLTDQTDYDQTNGSTNEGLGHVSGRVTAFARAGSGALYAAVSNGGVWQSDDDGAGWRPIGDGLPTEVVSGVAWTPANGGTIVVLTGDNAYGGDTYAGLGVYRSTDGGASWQHSAGVPDGILGFKLAVDPNDPNRIYAATGGGLFQSTDAGATFANVNLPTGANAPQGTPDCSGKPNTAKDCFLANMVTDVVVQGPANANTPAGKPGAVMAAVGWRAGQKQNADGSEQSPGNGVYVSDTGAPNTFKNIDIASHAIPNPPTGADPLTQDKIGRTALGIASGPDQNHKIVYAIIQDASKFNGQPAGIDANEPGGAQAAQSDFLNAIWVSTDFGASWRELEGASAIDQDTTSGSALAPPTCKAPAVIGYCPGIQAWYNLWVQPDPTLSTASGVPKRLAFGLEEVWSNDLSQTPPTGLDGSTSQKFRVIGRYYAGSTCTLLNATNGLPICPAAPGGQVPATTTHPDQHGVLFAPDGSGGVTLFVGNDGGVYKQHVDGSSDFSNSNWGTGQNAGLHTLQPYDAAMAKDGTVYMGLQDNGEGKIDPSGKSYSVFGGDGGFTAVDPDNADVAYEEYTYGAMSVTSDGGKHWTSIQPSNMTSSQFTTPFQMDPLDANHLMIGGRQIFETTAGTGTTPSSWSQVYDLGTQKKPGDASAGGTTDVTGADGPDSQLSAVDLHSVPLLKGAPTGPHTKNFSYTVDATIPGGGSGAPGTYDDHPFTIGPNDGDLAAVVDVSWQSTNDDYDVYLYKADSDGNPVGDPIAESANGGTNQERIYYPNPAAGNYVIEVVNFTAPGPLDPANVNVTFPQRTVASTVDKYQADYAYVGYCGYCDTITQGTPFANGIATNVAGDKPGAANKSDGWHIAKATGLPSRYITSVRMDASDPNTVYVTLAGYGRRWAFPGAVGEDTSKIGTGHVFKSTDAGASFRNVSGDLPDAPANWSVVHNGHLVVGTDIGVFESCDMKGTAYSRLGTNLPTAPIATMRFKPGDPDTLVAATYGRGVYTYHFADDNLKCPAADVAAARNAGLKACRASRAFARTSVKPRGHGLRMAAPRRNRPLRYTAFVFKQAANGRVLAPRPVALFSGRRGPINWSGRANVKHRRVTDGYYFVRFGLKFGTLGDVNRTALVRRHARWHLLRDFDYNSACNVVRQYKLSGPTFGGTKRRPLGISFRLAVPGGSTVRVLVKRGKHTVKRYSVRRPGTRMHTIKLPARRLRTGDYRVTLTARIGGRAQKLTLGSRRI